MVVTVLSEPSHRSLQRDSWEHDKKCSPRSLQTHHLQTQNLSDLKEELEDSIEFEEKFFALPLFSYSEYSSILRQIFSLKFALVQVF